MLDNVLNDAGQLQETFLMLMTNQSQASAWIGHVMDSVIAIVMEVELPTTVWACTEGLIASA